MMAEHLLPRQPGRHKPLWSRWVVLLSCVMCLASYNSSGDSGTPPTDPLQTLIVTIAEPIALAVEADGSLVVMDGVLDAVVRVHPTTGHHTLVSGLGRGSGSFVGFPAGIAVAPDGALMVTYNGVEAGAVVRMDPITGDRTVLSGCAAVDDSFKCTSLIGAGHPLDFPSDIAVEANGDLVVTDGEAVVRVHAATGKRTLVSGLGRGDGRPLSSLMGIVVEADGDLVVTDPGSETGAVVRIHPSTGDRTVLSGCGTVVDDSFECTSLIGAGHPLDFPSDIAVEVNGDLVVTAVEAVVRVHAATGDRTVLSGCIENLMPCSNLIGTGPLLIFPTSIAVMLDGALVVTNRDFVGPGAIVRVDPVTGNRTVLPEDPNNHIGTGLPLRAPIGIAVEADGALVVTDGEAFGPGAVVRVDPATGDRTVLSGCSDVDPTTLSCLSAIIGTGPPLLFPTSMAVMPDGSLIVTDTNAQAVVRVDPVTGDRTVLSGCIAENFTTLTCFSSGIGAGSPFRSPIGIAVEPNGTLVVADGGTGVDTAAIVRVDPVTGDRTVLSGCDPGADDSFECTSLIGTGPPLDFGLLGGGGGIAVEADGTLVVTTLPSAVVRVHPTTGDRTILSGCDVRIFPCPTPIGAGPPLAPKGLAVMSDGTLVVTTLPSAVVRVHPPTGDRAPVSDLSIGSGPLLLSPEGIAEEADGALVVADRFLRAVVRVDPLTGNRKIISR